MNADISNYKIVESSTTVDLEQEVLKLMGEGWIPKGGMVTNGIKYWQTLVKINVE